MRKRKLLFAMAGVGAGNITRTMAILDELDPDRFDIAFVAQGRSRELAPRGFPIYALEDVSYGTGSFTAWSILRRNGSFPMRFLRNSRVCAQALDEVRPDLLIVDSDFYCFGEARRRKIPIVSVNSSPATVAMVRRMGGPASGMFFSYYCVEKVDRFLQRSNADRIVCPVLEPVETGMSKVVQVPPIVRRQFLDEPAADAHYDVAVLLGGSGIGASEIDLRSVTGSMVVLGEALEGRYPPTAERVPFTIKSAPYLARARILVIQAGLNSVSEAIALRKPTVILPIRNHVEQFVNADCAQRLGIGLMARGPEAGAAVQTVLERYDDMLAACHALSLPCDGAVRAAGLIQEMAGA